MKGSILPGRAIVLGLALVSGGCAVDFSGVDPGTVVTAGGQNSMADVDHSTSGLGSEDRALLRDSHKLFNDTVGGKDVRGKNEQSAGGLRIYRWGTNGGVPLSSYAWNENAGERWHVVRGSCDGNERESCGRSGIRPIDEFYLAENVTITAVDLAGPESRGIQYGRPVLLK